MRLAGILLQYIRDAMPKLKNVLRKRREKKKRRKVWDVFFWPFRFFLKKKFFLLPCLKFSTYSIVLVLCMRIKNRNNVIVFSSKIYGSKLPYNIYVLYSTMWHVDVQTQYFFGSVGMCAQHWRGPFQFSFYQSSSTSSSPLSLSCNTAATAYFFLKCGSGAF